MQRTFEIFREWEIPLAVLFAYYLVAALVIWLVHTRWCGKRRASNPRRYRVIFALTLAIVFTPSVISDFWLFMIPGPAVLELLFLLPSVFPHPLPVLYVITVVCLAPLAAGFGVFYLALWFLDRRRANAAQFA
jgi:hypothetical protein